MNGIMSWISSISLLGSMGDSDDDDLISVQDILLAATFSSVLALSYVFQHYRNSERLNDAKIVNLNRENSELTRKYRIVKEEIRKCELSELEQKKEFKKILAQISLIAAHQHSNLSK